MAKEYYFTSESVGIGHPDKVCDRISDAILDACLSYDKDSRVAVETLVTTQKVVVSGEVTTKADVNYEAIVRETIKEIGYDKAVPGFDYVNADIEVLIHSQSPDISQGVSEGAGLYKEQGAGDQGIMFGYATNETASYMPLAISLSHKIVEKARELREQKVLSYLKPDCKSQVTVLYGENNKAKELDTIVFSTHHAENVSLEQVRKETLEKIIKPVCGNLLTERTKILINPTGRFVVGGPNGDTGLTGRKIIVDTYGGYGRHGGGAFSGKDSSKVDRSAAYAARWVAKNIVAAGLADKCEIQLSYAIGYPEPTSIHIETFNTNKVPEEKIEQAVKKVFNLTPKRINEALNLKNPIYKKTSFGGHFGQKPEGHFFTWERLNKIEELREVALT
ncbi:MAG: methionine adenosyltransferase [Nanoarchaeota archaeon]|jgi:S-adenosylmethionine synthetase|nr:methionine adenosyltransferase [Nanoarchaeota archaeon]